MISRRPETWTSGEETDNEKAEQPMASPQHQHQHQLAKAEAQRPGSSGWGTCAELLLVSAVKKHGALNWNLIALELKARAILLNLSPSCFSEEACRFRYNVLKGKFASSSNSGVTMGDAVDLDGGVLFEELRKVRMSHLKQELQQYDSSIGQLQSRIRKMKEERAQPKPHANIKQAGESNSADVYPKPPRSSDMKAPMARKHDEPLEKAAAYAGKSHVQPDFYAENLNSPFDISNRRRPSSGAQESHLLGKEVQLGSSSKTLVKDLSADGQLAGECSSGKRLLPGQNDEQALRLENEESVKVDNSTCNEGEFRVPLSTDPERAREEFDRKVWIPLNPRPHQISRPPTVKGEKDREKARSRIAGSDKLEQGDVAQSADGLNLHVEVPSIETSGVSPRVLEPSAPNQVSDGRDSKKSSNAKPTLEDKPKNDPLKAPGGSTDAEVPVRYDPAGRSSDAEVKEGNGSKGESGVTKDPDFQRPPTISYGRSVSKNRSKLRDGGRSMGQESRPVPTTPGSKPQGMGEGGGLQDDDSRAKSKSLISSEQRVEKGKAIGSDLVPCENLDSGSSKGGSESALTTDCQEAGDKVVELTDLSDVRKPSSNGKNVEFNGRDGKKVTSGNKVVVGTREGNDKGRPMSNNKVLGVKEASEEKKPTNLNNRVIGAKQAGDEKKMLSINKVTGSREDIDEKKVMTLGRVVESLGIADRKRSMSISKILNRNQSQEKKQASKPLEAREQKNDGNRPGHSSKMLECSELLEGKKPSSSKLAEARDVNDVKKPPNSILRADVAEVLGPSGCPDSVAERNHLSGSVQSLDTSSTPSTSSDLPPKVVPSPGRPEVIPTRRRSESPQVFPETVSVKGSRSPRLLQGESGEQKAGTRMDNSHKLKRLDSWKAVTAAEGERKRKGVPKPSSFGTGEGWPLKRQLEKKPKTLEMDTDGVKERKSDLKPDRSRSLTNDVSDTLCRKESGDTQEESRYCLESGDRQQTLVDFDTGQIEKSEVGSSMDSIDDMSPSSRKNRREPKVPGKFLPLLECLRVICAHKSAPLFKQRQEYQEKRHYNSVVKRHMDLGMVRARLEDGAYSGSVEFFRDLLLLCTNALVYSSKDAQEYAGAKALRSCALVEMEKILQTEALLKQNGPATRKRDVRKSMEMHRNRLASGSGVEGRRKSSGKNNSEVGADIQCGQQRIGPGEDSPKAGGSSDGNEDEREVDGRSETFKKPIPNRVMREESQRKEAHKTELNTEGKRSSLHVTGKKPKADHAAQPSKSFEAEEARHSDAGLLDNSENVSTKLPPKLKDVICLDKDKKGAGVTKIGAHPRPPQPTKQGSAQRPGHNTTSRGSRYSKRAGDSSGSNPKKRSRK